MDDIPRPQALSTHRDVNGAQNDLDLTGMAELLSASGHFRVQRSLEPRRFVNAADGTPTKTGLFVDVETTGLDPDKDEVIELAMMPFSYSFDGRIFEILEPFECFHEPSTPIPDAIIRLTGITDAMVAGRKIDPLKVMAFASNAALVVAHNAAFDRRFVERISDVFATMPWACSRTQIDWVHEGHEGTKLGYLATGAGFFYDRHRAAHDCRAAIELLATPLPKTGQLALSRLLERARRPTWRIWAENSPYDLKDILKARGYNWNGDDNPNPRAWYIDVEDEQRETEIAYLCKEIYLRGIELLVHKMTAYNRFSDRV
jgi:DNA polymerase III subunit epsilon